MTPICRTNSKDSALKIAYKPISGRFSLILSKSTKASERRRSFILLPWFPNRQLRCSDRNSTQNISVSLQVVQAWLGSSGVNIWDCSATGHLLQNSNMFAKRKGHEVNMMQAGYLDGARAMIGSLQLRCGANERLSFMPRITSPTGCDGRCKRWIWHARLLQPRVHAKCARGRWGCWPAQRS